MDIAQQSETRRDFAPIFLFAITLFTSASLMFVLQPMYGKVLLPLLGGAASVWTVCMVFYQSVLFLGYLYAHILSHYFNQYRQILIHGLLILISLSFLPISPSESTAPPAETNPTLWLLTLLSLSIGLPFFVLSTTSPLIQKWFSKIGHKTSHDPYYLSIASNTGSLLALLSYPFLLEPRVGLTDQQLFWSAGFFVLCGLIAWCMMVYKRQGDTQSQEQQVQVDAAERPGLSLKLQWLILAFVPSSLLLGTTNYISIDIASVPLLWVIPLALYLISFIIVFSKFSTAIHKWMLFLQPWIIAPFLVFYFSGSVLTDFLTEIILHLLAFFITIMVCHGEMARKRPAAQYLTDFYLIMSVGGMLGGMFNSFIAPQIFNAIYEYPLMIIIGVLLNPTNNSNRLYLKEKIFSWYPGTHQSQFSAHANGDMSHEHSGIRSMSRFFRQNFVSQLFFVYLCFFLVILYFNVGKINETLFLGVLIVTIFANYFIFHKNPVYLVLYSMILVSCAVTPDNLQDKSTIYQGRNFYGVLAIEKDDQFQLGTQETTIHTLYSGSTEHGAQLIINDNWQCTPVSYYGRQGPLGQLFKRYHPVNGNWQIGVVGLGAGEMAAYAKETQSWDFFEINPAVVDIATNPEYFTYLNHCVENYSIKTGDARLMLNKEPEHRYDLLVIDAFTSDSIPTHLLTEEAIALYLSKLNDNGLLVFHISNRHLAVKKVLSAHVQTMGLTGLLQEFRPTVKTPLVHKSDWAVLAKNEQALKPLLEDPAAWKKVDVYVDNRPWTDDFTSIVSIWK